jgi:hypothetical protein
MAERPPVAEHRRNEMKTMTTEKPVHKAARTNRGTERARNDMRRGGQPTLRTSVDQQVAEFERTFSVRWEW